MSYIVGNDISSYQGSINFDTLKNNANFVIIKATEGVGVTDHTFTRNQSEARRVGLAIGYYHFAHPELNSAIDEANCFCSVVKPQVGEILILDYEANWSGDPVAWSKSFLDQVYSIYNCRPLIYLNQSLATSHDWSSVSSEYGLWIAAYTGSPTDNSFKSGSWSTAAIQQWTNNQTVPGIPTGVDGDVFFGTIEQFKLYGYKGGATMNMYTMKSGNQVDLDNVESMKVCADVFDQVVNQKIYTLNTDAAVAAAAQYNKGFADGKASVPPPTLTDLPASVTAAGIQWNLNGVNLVDGQLQGNYNK